jgi:hypothetical protein
MARYLLGLPFQHGLLELLSKRGEEDGKQDIREKRAGLLKWLTGKGSGMITGIGVKTFGKEISMEKLSVETRERDFPGDEDRDGLRVYCSRVSIVLKAELYAPRTWQVMSGRQQKIGLCSGGVIDSDFGIVQYSIESGHFALLNSVSDHLLRFFYLVLTGESGIFFAHSPPGNAKNGAG